MDDFLKVAKLKKQVKIEAENWDLEESFGKLFNDIKNINNKEDRNDLFDVFVEKIKNALITWDLNSTEAYSSVMKVRNELKIYGGLTEKEVDELFLKYDFNAASLSKYNNSNLEENRNVMESDNILDDKELENIIENIIKDIDERMIKYNKTNTGFKENIEENVNKELEFTNKEIEEHLDDSLKFDIKRDAILNLDNLDNDLDLLDVEELNLDVKRKPILNLDNLDEEVNFFDNEEDVKESIKENTVDFIDEIEYVDSDLENELETEEEIELVNEEILDGDVFVENQNEELIMDNRDNENVMREIAEYDLHINNLLDKLGLDRNITELELEEEINALTNGLSIDKTDELDNKGKEINLEIAKLNKEKVTLENALNDLNSFVLSVDGFDREAAKKELEEKNLAYSEYEKELYDNQVSDYDVRTDEKLLGLNNDIIDLKKKVSMPVIIKSIEKIDDRDALIKELEEKEAEYNSYQAELYENNISNDSQYEDTKLNDLRSEIANLNDRINNPRIAITIDSLEAKASREKYLEEKRNELTAYENDLISQGYEMNSFQMDEKWVELRTEVDKLEEHLNDNVVIETIGVYEDVEPFKVELNSKKEELSNLEDELINQGYGMDSFQLSEDYRNLRNEIDELENRINNPRIVNTLDNVNKKIECQRRIDEINRKIESKNRELDNVKANVVAATNSNDRLAKLNKLKKLMEQRDYLKGNARNVSNNNDEKLGLPDFSRDDHKKPTSTNNTGNDGHNGGNSTGNNSNTGNNGTGGNTSNDNGNMGSSTSDSQDNDLDDDNTRGINDDNKNNNDDLDKDDNGIKKITDKVKNEKLLLKGLAAVAGFGTGLALSSVPGVGVIRMGLAGAKFAIPAINAYADKHPGGRIDKIRQGIIDKLGPELVDKINNMRNKLKQSPLNYFVNGVAAGYIVGNVVEMISGESILEHLKGDKTTKVVEGFKPSAGGFDELDNSRPREMWLDESMDTIMANNSEMLLNKGDVVDLRALARGMVSSDATESVKLLEGAGKEVVFDKAVKLPNGKIMWHFKQLTGEGYAWFDAKDVQAVLNKASEIGTKTL